MKELHYLDSHAHIMAEEYQEDFEEMLKRAEDAHVDRIMIITLSHEETIRALAFARRDPGRYKVAAGIFPEDVKNVSDEDWQVFEKTAADPEVTCIGEIGLDYYWEKNPEIRKLQREYFIRQIELAKKLNKPFLVHSRDAIQDTYDIMKAHHGRGLMHCYSGTKEMAREFVKLGYYIALGGAVTFKNARHSVEVCADIDENYLLSETDCPYMAPVPKRGKRNEPSYIPYIVNKMAEVRGVSEEYMAEVIDRNWTRFLEGKE
ncbi:MAG: TatD family deoxyribonuclease [Erysipelotrichaceae bacterium]|nr:TatD family deoxyribonuclease [Erysipelotrichaceae bacterium]